MNKEDDLGLPEDNFGLPENEGPETVTGEVARALLPQNNVIT